MRKALENMQNIHKMAKHDKLFGQRPPRYVLFSLQQVRLLKKGVCRAARQIRDLSNGAQSTLTLLGATIPRRNGNFCQVNISYF